MKHLRKFENNNKYVSEWAEKNMLSEEDQKRWEPDVREIYKVFIRQGAAHASHDHDVYLRFISEVQSEFDDKDGELPDLYIIRQKYDPDGEEFEHYDDIVEVCEAYGPKHSLARFIVDGGWNVSGVFDNQFYSYQANDADIKRIISKHQRIIDMVENPSTL